MVDILELLIEVFSIDLEKRQLERKDKQDKKQNRRFSAPAKSDESGIRTHALSDQMNHTRKCTLV
jgi:hypothetical protein